jgi:hypothetical protein
VTNLDIKLVKDENGDLLSDSHNISNGGRAIFFSVIECA